MRRPGAAVLVGLLTSLLLLGTTPAAAELSAVGSESVSAVAACTAQADHLLAAVVVDESSSLRDTDPGDLRVGAIETALDSLERLADDGDALTVEARLSVFGETSTELVGWGDLAGGHAEELRTAVREELPERDGARLTDYRRALGDAQAALGDRAAELGGTACKLVLWLTDGKLDVDGWGEGPATAAARAELCEPGGLVDGVRADGITVVAMGLMTSAGRGAVTDLDRDRLRAIAEGSAGSESCGTAPVPADVTNGAFLNADDAGALARLFAEMGALLEGLTPSGTVGCPGAECPDGRFPIAADPSVGGFRLVAESTPDAAAMHLVAPDGTTVVLDRPTTDVGGSSVSVLVTGSLTTVDVRGLERNTGTWTLVTDPTATTLIDLYHFWGVTLTVEAPHGVVIGEPSELRITPRTTDGSPVHLDTYSSTTLEATVGGEVHELRPDGDGWATDVTVPADAAPSSLVVTGRATAVTHPNGIELGPVMVEQSLTTQFPASFPVPTPARVDPPTLLARAWATVYREGWAQQAFDATYEHLAEEMLLTGASGYLDVDVDTAPSAVSPRGQLREIWCSGRARALLADRQADRLREAVHDGALTLPLRRVTRMGPHSDHEWRDEPDYFAALATSRTTFALDVFGSVARAQHRHYAHHVRVWLPRSAHPEAAPGSDPALRVEPAHGTTALRVDLSRRLRPRDLAVFAPTDDGPTTPTTRPMEDALGPYV